MTEANTRIITRRYLENLPNGGRPAQEPVVAATLCNVNHRIRGLCRLVLWVACASALAASQQSSPPPVPAELGKAAGTVTMGGTTVTLTHAYASGPVEWGGTVYQIVLTEKPLAAHEVADEVRERGGQKLLRSGKLQGISLLVDAEGFVRNAVPFVGELRGSRMIASAGRLVEFAVQQGRVTGRGSLSTEQTTGQGWTYAASWNAALVAR